MGGGEEPNHLYPDLYSIRGANLAGVPDYCNPTYRYLELIVGHVSAVGWVMGRVRIDFKRHRNDPFR